MVRILASFTHKKHTVPAAVVLSTMFMQGIGVPKDQAFAATLLHLIPINAVTVYCLDGSAIRYIINAAIGKTPGASVVTVCDDLGLRHKMFHVGAFLEPVLMDLKFS